MVFDVFYVSRIVIDGDPSTWHIDDIIIGNRSQLDRPGVPGNAIDYEMALEMVRSGMDVVIRATYVGNNPEGMPFGCTLHRTVVGFDPKLDSIKPTP